MKTFRAGVDIGGTFTDIVLLGDRGERYTKKVSSTVDDYARAITEGLAELLAEIGGEARGIAELLHGTTVASNAILEHKGAKTGLRSEERRVGKEGRSRRAPYDEKKR